MTRTTPIATLVFLLTSTCCWSAELGDSLITSMGPIEAQNQLAGARIVRQSQWDADGQRLVLRSTLHVDAPAKLPREIPLLSLAFPNAVAPHKGPFFEKLEYRNAPWYGSTFWTGPNWTRVGRDWHHPGEDTPSVRRFQSPRDGRATISGRVYKLHLSGDGIRARILHQDKQVWNAQIDGADDKGVEPNLTLNVRKGDLIRFVVDKRKGIACDTTHWDPVVTFAGGPTYQASKSFGDRDGRDGWSYEMLVDKPSATQEVLAYVAGRDLVLRPGRSIVGQPIALAGDEILPFVVLADAKGRSGMTVSWQGAQQWTLRTAADAQGRPTLSLTMPCPEGVTTTAQLPELRVAGFRGPWTAAATSIGDIAGPEIVDAWRKLIAALGDGPEFDLGWIVQAEWLRDDKIGDTAKDYAAAVADHLERTGRILAARTPASRQAALLDGLSAEAAKTNLTLPQWRMLYLKTRLLKRAVLLADPLVDFRQLVVCKRVPPSWSHLVAQYYGWRQRPGGGLFVLERPGRSLAARDIVAGQLPPGNFLEPSLSYDGRRIAFSYVECKRAYQPSELPVNESGPDEAYFHIYEIGVDGRGLRQLTSGPYDDMMPCHLPDGRIVFTSTRRKGYSRCFGPEYSNRWHSYTLHCIDGDGRNLRILSWNDVSEWFPAVSAKGEILFARWDYIDRDAVTHQNLWSVRPDGTNPVAVWGNATSKPHCAFQARSIPNSNKIVFIASAHHAITGGPVVLLDPSVDANRPEAITRITPGPFPEAEGGAIPEYYESPWPLSENLFLVAYSADRLRFQGEHPRDPNPDNALGVYLLDTSGNRELIYRDPRTSATSPRPLVARRPPPVIASPVVASSDATGEMMLSDIYQGLGDAPRGSIKRLRIVQVFPKTTPWANSPRIGVAGEENARAILGTVPVERDGSARFLLPAGKPVLFQALDEQGVAYRTMRSLTYVQPGERTACIGCHEHPHAAPPAGRPMAMQRPASVIEPGELGGRPFSFVEVVQPVLDKHCVECHRPGKADGDVDLTGTPFQQFTRSYWSLCGLPADATGQKRDFVPPKGPPLVPRFVQRNQIQVTPPGGEHGARGSRLMKLLLDGHEKVKLAPAELQRIAAWIDLNAVFYGGYSEEERAAQLQGKTIAMPEIQ